ncbi:hypothetical protein HDU81_001474 [Chytriomyces hyalinus]|nr:hypothetical protein HDU81_001474 [Chytriomyces hyalinus]
MTATSSELLAMDTLDWWFETNNALLMESSKTTLLNQTLLQMTAASLMTPPPLPLLELDMFSPPSSFNNSVSPVDSAYSETFCFDFNEPLFSLGPSSNTMVGSFEKVPLVNMDMPSLAVSSLLATSVPSSQEQSSVEPVKMETVELDIAPAAEVLSTTPSARRSSLTPSCSSPTSSSSGFASSSASSDEEDDLYKEIKDAKLRRGRRNSKTCPPIFKCPFPACCKTFNRSFNLRAHYATHLGTKSFSCGGCEKKFTRRFDVKRHQSSGPCVGHEIQCL